MGKRENRMFEMSFKIMNLKCKLVFISTAGWYPGNVGPCTASEILGNLKSYV